MYTIELLPWYYPLVAQLVRTSDKSLEDLRSSTGWISMSCSQTYIVFMHVTPSYYQLQKMRELLSDSHDATRSKLAGMPVSMTSKRQATAIFYSEI